MTRYLMKLTAEVLLALSTLASGQVDLVDAYETVRQASDERIGANVRRQRAM